MNYPGVGKKAFRASAACAWSLVFVTSAWSAADWQPELLEARTRGPLEPVRLRISGLAVERFSTLTLEVDDVDVTGFVQPDKGQLVFAPPQPLAFGVHRVRLVENTPEGDIVERGVWDIEVRRTAAFRDVQARANLTVNGADRFADSNLSDPLPKRRQVDGGMQLQGALANGSWSATADADLLGTSNSQNLLRAQKSVANTPNVPPIPPSAPSAPNVPNMADAADDKVQLGNFLLTGQSGPFSVAGGHHQVGPDSLIMAAFNRRGVSGSLSTAEHTASLTAFAMRPDDLRGFQRGFGVGDSDNRIDGAIVSGRPLAAQGSNLTLWGTYLSGKSSLDQTRGNATSVAADGDFFARHLRLRTEYARTEFDFDGAGADTDGDGVIDSNLSAEPDDAYAALLVYTPWHDKTIAERPFTWNVGAERKRIGTNFRSPADPAGIADRDLVRAFTAVSWAGLDVNLSLGKERDNVNDIESQIRTETAQNLLSVSYAPSPALPTDPAQPVETPWYGQPLYNATWFSRDQDVLQGFSFGGVTFVPTGPMVATQSVSFSANFSYPTWNWSLVRIVSKNRDFGEFGLDTTNRLTALNASWRVGEKLSVGPTLQLNDTTSPDQPSLNTEVVTVGLNLGYAFSERLNAALRYNLNRSRADDGSMDTTATDIGGNLSWLAIRAQGASPGLTLILDGQRNELDDRVFGASNRGTYQIFARAALSWQPSY